MSVAPLPSQPVLSDEEKSALRFCELLSAGDDLLKELRDAAAAAEDEAPGPNGLGEAVADRAAVDGERSPSPLALALTALASLPPAEAPSREVAPAPAPVSMLEPEAHNNIADARKRSAKEVLLAAKTVLQPLTASLPQSWPSVDVSTSLALLETVAKAMALLYELAETVSAEQEAEAASDEDEDDEAEGWDAGWGEDDDSKASEKKPASNSKLRREEAWELLEATRNSLRRLCGFGAALFLTKAFKFPPPPSSFIDGPLSSLKQPTADDFENTQKVSHLVELEAAASSAVSLSPSDERCSSILAELLSSLMKLQRWSHLYQSTPASSPASNAGGAALSTLPTVLWAVQVVSDPVLKRFRSFVLTQILKDKDFIAALAAQGTKAKVPEPRPELEQLLGLQEGSNIGGIFAWLWTNAINETSPLASSLKTLDPIFKAAAHSFCGSALAPPSLHALVTQQLLVETSKILAPALTPSFVSVVWSRYLLGTTATPKDDDKHDDDTNGERRPASAASSPLFQGLPPPAAGSADKAAGVQTAQLPRSTGELLKLESEKQKASGRYLAAGALSASAAVLSLPRFLLSQAAGSSVPMPAAVEEEKARAATALAAPVKRSPALAPMPAAAARVVASLPRSPAPLMTQQQLLKALVASPTRINGGSLLSLLLHEARNEASLSLFNQWASLVAEICDCALLIDLCRPHSIRRQAAAGSAATDATANTFISHATSASTVLAALFSTSGSSSSSDVLPLLSFIITQSATAERLLSEASTTTKSSSDERKANLRLQTAAGLATTFIRQAQALFPPPNHQTESDGASSARESKAAKKKASLLAAAAIESAALPSLRRVAETEASITLRGLFSQRTSTVNQEKAGNNDTDDGGDDDENDRSSVASSSVRSRAASVGAESDDRVGGEEDEDAAVGRDAIQQRILASKLGAAAAKAKREKEAAEDSSSSSSSSSGGGAGMRKRDVLKAAAQGAAAAATSKGRELFAGVKGLASATAKQLMQQPPQKQGSSFSPSLSALPAVASSSATSSASASPVFGPASAVVASATSKKDASRSPAPVRLVPLSGLPQSQEKELILAALKTAGSEASSSSFSSSSAFTLSSLQSALGGAASAIIRQAPLKSFNSSSLLSSSSVSPAALLHSSLLRACAVAAKDSLLALEQALGETGRQLTLAAVASLSSALVNLHSLASLPAGERRRRQRELAPFWTASSTFLRSYGASLRHIDEAVVTLSQAVLSSSSGSTMSFSREAVRPLSIVRKCLADLLSAGLLALWAHLAAPGLRLLVANRTNDQERAEIAAEAGMGLLEETAPVFVATTKQVLLFLAPASSRTPFSLSLHQIQEAVRRGLRESVVALAGGGGETEQEEGKQKDHEGPGHYFARAERLAASLQQAV